DLEGLTERLIVMRERDAEQIFATADCRLTITRELGEHHDGHFAFTVGRRLVWEPEGCSLTVFAAGREAVVGPDYSPLYRDAAGSEMDLLFEVERNGQKFTLTSIDLPSVNDAWAAYGCAKPDRLRYSLVRIKGVP